MSSADLTASHMGALLHGLRTKIQNAKREKEDLEKKIQNAKREKEDLEKQVERLDAHISFWEEQLNASSKPSSQGGRSYRKKRNTHSKRKTHRKRK